MRNARLCRSRSLVHIAPSLQLATPGPRFAPPTPPRKAPDADTGSSGSLPTTKTPRRYFGSRMASLFYSVKQMMLINYCNCCNIIKCWQPRNVNVLINSMYSYNNGSHAVLFKLY